MNPVVRVATAVLATYGAGFVAYLFVDSQVGSWYASLAKPAATPSDSTFIIVWLILFALMAGALVLVWGSSVNTPHIEGWVRFYFVSLLFNAMWTIFFFGLHAMLLAFADILLLLFIIGCLIAAAWETDYRASYLLMPYFAWLVFAAYLDLVVWYMN